MNHQIKLETVEDYAFEHQIAASFGKGANKELKALVANGLIKYEVYNQKELIVSTGSAMKAVEAYNTAI